MKQLDEFLIDEDMRAVIEHDLQYPEERNFGMLTAEVQLTINTEPSLFWSSEKPLVARVQNEAIFAENRPIELCTFFPTDGVGGKFIIWVHGDGWKEGSLDVFERLARIFANASNCVVFEIGYSKASGAQFSAQTDEMFSVFQHTANSMFPDRLEWNLTGYSVGANFILSILTAYKKELYQEYFQRACHVCGVYDWDFATPSYSFYEKTLFESSKARVLEVLETYAPSAVFQHHPMVFPIRSYQSICDNFLVIYAERDLLHDDSVILGMGNITLLTAPLLFFDACVGKFPLDRILMPSLVIVIIGYPPVLLLTSFNPALWLWLPRLVVGIE